MFLLFPGWMAILQDGEDHTMQFTNALSYTNVSYNARFYDFQEGDFLKITHMFNQSPDR